MRTKFFLTTFLAVILSSSVLLDGNRGAAADPIKSQVEEITVKAIHVNGELHPMIELPVIEITAGLDQVHLTDAIVFEGEVIPAIELETVTITPNTDLSSI